MKQVHFEFDHDQCRPDHVHGICQIITDELLYSKGLNVPTGNSLGGAMVTYLRVGLLSTRQRGKQRSGSRPPPRRPVTRSVVVSRPDLEYPGPWLGEPSTREVRIRLDENRVGGGRHALQHVQHD